MISQNKVSELLEKHFTSFSAPFLSKSLKSKNYTSANNPEMKCKILFILFKLNFKKEKEIERVLRY